MESCLWGQVADLRCRPVWGRWPPSPESITPAFYSSHGRGGRGTKQTQPGTEGQGLARVASEQPASGSQTETLASRPEGGSVCARVPRVCAAEVCKVARRWGLGEVAGATGKYRGRGRVGVLRLTGRGGGWRGRPGLSTHAGLCLCRAVHHPAGGHHRQGPSGAGAGLWRPVRPRRGAASGGAPSL